jgi:TLD
MCMVHSSPACVGLRTDSRHEMTCLSTVSTALPSWFVRSAVLAALIVVAFFPLNGKIYTVSAFSTHPYQSLSRPARSIHHTPQWTTTYKTSPTQLAFFNFGKPQQEETKDLTPPPPEDEPDLVEKVFSLFFGKPEESPLGLKRFGKERFPEQYPAVTDEWAEAVRSDSADMARVRPVLKNTNLESRALRVTYDANKQGWSATKFHQAVDKQGGALVVCTTRSGLLCGGYNPKGWVGYGENRGSIAAFLFVQNSNPTTKPQLPFIKLRKVGGAGMAQMDNPECGPCFGADALVIPLNASDNPRLARSKLGSYYERFADGTNSLFGKNMASVQLSDLKVYHGVYEEGEYVPFTDAEPFALY